MDFLKKRVWSPYFVGACIGLVVVLLFITGFEMGVTSAVAKVVALVEQALFPLHIAEGSYFHQVLSNQTLFDWRILFTVGLLVGAYLASKISKGAEAPKNILWSQIFGASKKIRYIAAFCGGILLMLGARLADGCTSGHAICGGAQLSLTSWLFMMALFATAVPFSLIIYRKRRRS
jgi:uncharacterized protein